MWVLISINYNMWKKVITCEYSRSIVITTYFQLLFSNHFLNLIKQRMNRMKKDAKKLVWKQIKSLQQSAFPMISKWYKQNMKVEIFYVLYPHVSVIISKSTWGFNFTKSQKQCSYLYMYYLLFTSVAYKFHHLHTN